MASGSVPVFDEDELKGDGKKRKFKPLEAVRKFFGKGKRKHKDEQVSVVAVKAKSTTALHHGQTDEDDDDGGFKNRKPRPLGGNRSISEDSIFSPEQKEPNLEALKKAAVSEESIPKSAFQAELFSKLNKRRSQYSDEDDGLPHSPTPPVTTADIIMGGPLKPLPAAGKSTSRESDNSLISMDTSDNEEDDPFQSKWKKSVPSKVSKEPSPSGDSDIPIDFDKVAQTELLKSDLAKDRISIKPRSRKVTRQSRKKREGQSPHSLPSLNEESIPKARTESVGASSVSESHVDSTGMLETRTGIIKFQGSPPEERPSISMSLEKQSSTPIPAAQKPSPTTPSLGAAKSVVSSEPEKKEVKEEVKRLSVKIDTVSSVVKENNSGKVSFDSGKQDTVSIARGSVVITSTTEEVVKKEKEPELSQSLPASVSTDQVNKEQDSGGVSSKLQSSAAFSSRNTSAVEASSGAPRTRADVFPSSVKSSVSNSSPARPVISDSASTPSSEASVNKTTVVTYSSSASNFSPSIASSSSSNVEMKKEGLRQTDSQTTTAFSPKDDYKLRRQSRSKTLPEQPVIKEEPFASRVQRAASHRMETSSQNSSQAASPETSPRHRERAVDSSKSKEPEWFALARKKMSKQDSEKSDSPSPSTETVFGKEPTPVSESSHRAATQATTKSEVVSKSVETVSSASSKFERLSENKPSEVSRTRGGSVKTSPTKVNVFPTRGHSVKAASTKSEVDASSGSSNITSSSLKTSSSFPVQPASANAGTKGVDIKEEPKTADSSPRKDMPKWKTQSVKTTSTMSSSTTSAISSSRVSSVKALSNSGHSSGVSSGSATSGTTESSAKRAPLIKAASDEKSGVPAWRANLSQKKAGPSDIKIELIESSSSGGSSNKAPQKEETSKKPDSPTKTNIPSKDSTSFDQCHHSSTPSRNSKVMNLLKNFENVQGVS